MVYGMPLYDLDSGAYAEGVVDASFTCFHLYTSSAYFIGACPELYPPLFTRIPKLLALYESHSPYGKQ